jgi:hypothetical protein
MRSTDMIDEGTHTGIPASDRLGASMEPDEGGVMSRCYGQFRETIEHRPASSVTSAFLVGFGIGAALGWLLARPEPPRARWYGVDTAERLGQKVLDALQGVLPEKLRS